MSDVSSPSLVDSSPRQPRQNNFNLIRLILAVLVILSHSASLVDGDGRREALLRVFHTISFGEFAVDGFFILSGYLILQSWEAAPRLPVFAAKRLLRIYPGYLIAALVSGLIVGPLGAAPLAFWSQLRGSAFLLSVSTLRGPAVPPVFQGLPFPSVNGSMWTIFWEFGCYIAIACLGKLGISKHLKLWLGLTAALLIIPALPKLGLEVVLLGHRVPFEHPIFRLAGQFFVGGAYYLLREVTPRSALLAVGSLGLLVLCLFNRIAAEPALAVFGGYCLLWLAFLRWSPILRFNRLPDISYGVYLYAWPIQKLLLWKVAPFSPLSLFAVASLLCVPVALVSWYAVEKPFLSLKPVRPLVEPGPLSADLCREEVTTPARLPSSSA